MDKVQSENHKMSHSFPIHHNQVGTGRPRPVQAISVSRGMSLSAMAVPAAAVATLLGMCAWCAADSD